MEALRYLVAACSYNIPSAQVDYSGDYPVIPPNRFGQQFVKKVANPSTILHWMKKKRQTTLRELCASVFIISSNSDIIIIIIYYTM